MKNRILCTLIFSMLVLIACCGETPNAIPDENTPNGNFTNHADVYDDEGDLVDSICEPNKSAKFIDLTYAQVLEFSYSPKKLMKE